MSRRFPAPPPESTAAACTPQNATREAFRAATGQPQRPVRAFSAGATTLPSLTGDILPTAEPERTEQTEPRLELKRRHNTMTDAHAYMEKSDDGVATITLNRPEKMNAITFQMFVRAIAPQPLTHKSRLDLNES